MKTTASFVMDEATLAAISAEAVRLRSSKSYALRELILAATNTAGRSDSPSGGGGPGLMEPGTLGGRGSSNPRPSFSNIVENTMDFQNRHNQRQRAARLREAQAKDEAARKATEATEAARRDGSREAQAIEQREEANDAG